MKFLTYLCYIIIQFVFLLIVRELFGFEVAALLGIADVAVDAYILKTRQAKNNKQYKEEI